ncbi:MAG: UDP-N-acetylglucosamine 2-epimerase (non-hydrolyzing) [Magnetococcales bacterium]|nr:UDP-N-acetylglucosamine 2-epimerase (non-hydrolyzing) [Magnetococcales bacterium]NGZ26380.1 UDP-N-acetylglucosamine 2-epimerase (non-hydrolyzing) [Magnetococcales bacterium]
MRAIRLPFVDIIAGARPNFMKVAPIIHGLQKRQLAGGKLDFRLVHTGQHYDVRMSGDFFEQLSIPPPDINLAAGSGSQAEQTAAIMIGYERLLHEQPSSLCLVVGDVNSTMACAIVAQKQGIPVAHVEGGLRSHDWSMPEEINRLVTDAISNLFFTTSTSAGDNLLHSGVPASRIHFVGNTMIDTLLQQLPNLRPPAFWNPLSLTPQSYLVLTLHRPTNVDNPTTLSNLLTTICATCQNTPVIFPVHPRTAKTLATLPPLPIHLHQVEPQPYLEFNYLVKHAKGVITDSGGITEEATVLGVPCMTLRTTTERPETITMGSNELIGEDPARLRTALQHLLTGQWKSSTIPPKWDGQTGQRIVAILEELFA